MTGGVWPCDLEGMGGAIMRVSIRLMSCITRGPPLTAHCMPAFGEFRRLILVPQSGQLYSGRNVHPTNLFSEQFPPLPTIELDGLLLDKTFGGFPMHLFF